MAHIRQHAIFGAHLIADVPDRESRVSVLRV